MNHCNLRIESSLDAYRNLFNALSIVPLSHYVLGFLVIAIVFLYNYLGFHFIEDVFTGFRGRPVSLTYNPDSHIYQGVVSKCRVLHGSYLATPWLSSPHLQTSFLNFFGRPPDFSYKRQLYRASDDQTIALDWLMSYDVCGSVRFEDDTTPIVVVIPGLTSDSSSAYLKHLAYDTARSGCNVVVTNHRGLGGVSVTSDCFYNAGWTEDAREIIHYLHDKYPKAPLFAIGTSIGANILVKYLGEDGQKIPLAGAVAICSPWDLLIGDRYICRTLLQKLYDRALAIGLQGYAQLHEPHYTRLANWEGILKSRSIRDFDNFATCLVGKFETVDTYYRRSSSAAYVANVSVPLLCISALDDPLCTREAIPWDECRANKNVVLATTEHGGHLAFFEGLTASSLWWVRAADEFLRVLSRSQYMHVPKKTSGFQSSTESSIDQGPYLNIAKDGMVAAISNESATKNPGKNFKGKHGLNKRDEIVPETEAEAQVKSNDMPGLSEELRPTQNLSYAKSNDAIAPMKRCLNKLSRQSKGSIWLLTYIAVATSWPWISSFIRMALQKRRRPTLLSKK